ncbi:DNA-binding response regulator, OmpR family, contains REC and winged-helix (wHTH) domain [Actinoplanes philippinensis]|uniref:DNA-binding response regulator, OmpR family, contains REC and winged-helix (WHTH) domain n=2 Tax=Actinoplanes philippinensis TaxID=35752 RepID=A0A1I2E6S7_9ACTN|nr:DNA-binding response regulator, OmpR family, contains REC and winged-helix (wHTH) domain [Actinoplanes philippinensis]
MLQPMRVLVIEDEPELAEILQRGLTAEGYTVDVARDGLTALELARFEDYAGILLDLMLPGLNGYRVCATLRREGIRTPILVLTAKDGDYDQIEALDTGADDFLSKPFSYPVLVARLRALVRRGPAAVPVRLAVGDLVLDRAARTCHRGTVPIPLTPREFAILDLLAHRAGEPVPKTDILRQVWPDEVEDPNLVEVRVGRLRRKVDLPFGRNSLCTVRGVGYRLVDDRARG